MIRCLGEVAGKMSNRLLAWRLCGALCAAVVMELACAAAAFGQANRATDDSFFAEKLYPVLHAAQCVRCHSDNGVASETDLAFPSTDATPEQVTAFGLSLLDFVDRKN